MSRTWTIGFSSVQSTFLKRKSLLSLARAAFGDTAVNAGKTVLSTSFDTIGWRFNTIEGTVAPSPRAVLKLIYVFNVATPPEAKAGTLVKVRHLQRLSALAIRYSRAIVPLRPFSASFAKNSGGTQSNRAATRHLSRPAHADIIAWRRALELGVADPRRLSVRASWVAMDAAPPHVQAARADIQIWVDAQGHGGIGVYAPGRAWDEAIVPDTTYYRSSGEPAAISNNIFEFFAILSGLAIVARDNKHLHVHVHTDNTAALAWTQKCRGDSGFHTFLIRVLCDVQIATGLHLTAGHVSGVNNVQADAISRQFNVPGGDEIRAQVEAAAPRVHLIGQLWSTFSNVLKMPSPTPSETDLAVRTALEFVIGTNSAQRT